MDQKGAGWHRFEAFSESFFRGIIVANDVIADNYNKTPLAFLPKTFRVLFQKVPFTCKSHHISPRCSIY
jgi:hypothetical protein